jgi:signal transduction histidine kinase
MTRQEKIFSRQQKILYWTMGVGLIILIAVNSLAWIYLQRIKTFFISDLKFRLENIARMGAQLFDPSEIALIFPENPNDPLFLNYQLILLDIKETNNLQDIYIINPALELIVDTETGLLSVPAKKNPDLSLIERALLNESAAGDIQTLGEHKFLTAASPLTDSNNIVTGILVVEARATFFNELEQFESGLRAFSAVNLLIIITVAFFLVRAVHRSFALQVQIQNQQNFVKLGEMAASVAHELRNPLSIIQGANTLIQKKYGTEEDEFFSYIPAELNRLNNLLENFLVFARMKPVNLKKVQITDLIEKIKIGFNDNLEQIQLDIPQNLPMIYTDENLLEQVLLNVIRNAIQASDTHDKIIVCCRLKGQFLEFRVKDEGSGIASDSLERVFDPFFTTREHGSGLGLAITKRLVEQLGGHIRIHSQLGEGTEITFTIITIEKP